MKVRGIMRDAVSALLRPAFPDIVTWLPAVVCIGWKPLTDATFTEELPLVKQKPISKEDLPLPATPAPRMWPVTDRYRGTSAPEHTLGSG